MDRELKFTIVDIFQHFGYMYMSGGDIAPDGMFPERESTEEIILVKMLRNSLEALNQKVIRIAREDALQQVLEMASIPAKDGNPKFFQAVFNGIPVTYERHHKMHDATVKIMDFETPYYNHFYLVDDFLIVENKKEIKPDFMIFINGIPMIILEFDEPNSIENPLITAYNKFSSYRDSLQKTAVFNAFVLLSDGKQAKIGKIDDNLSEFKSWKPSENNENVSPFEVLLHRVFEKANLLDIFKNFDDFK